LIDLSLALHNAADAVGYLGRAGDTASRTINWWEGFFSGRDWGFNTPRKYVVDKRTRFGGAGNNMNTMVDYAPS